MTAVNIVTTPEEMPVTETIELVARLRAEVEVPLGAVIVNRVLPELFTHADEETFEALREPDASALLTERAGRGRGRRCSTRRGSRCRCAARAPRTSTSCATTVDLPLLYVPVSVRARSRPARHAHGRRRARRGARPVSPRPEARATTLEQLFATKEIVVCCGSGGVGKTSVAAAAALGASVRLGGKTLVLTIDPARRLATALGLDGIGNEAHRVPPELLKTAGVEPRGELWAAMLDTKQSWDDLVRRHAQRRGDRATGSSRTGCTTTSPRASCRVTTTSRWSGCSRSTRRVSTT